MRIYLQSMVEDIPDSMLPQAWVDHDLEFFSQAKRPYDYQQQALRNALKALWKYYWGVESSLTPALSGVGSPLTPSLSPRTTGREGTGSVGSPSPHPSPPLARGERVKGVGGFTQRAHSTRNFGSGISTTVFQKTLRYN
jgi:hypothetical protein